MSKKAISYIFILLLFLSAIFLGYIIYQKAKGVIGSDSADVWNKTSSQAFTPTVDSSELSADEKTLLTPPGENAGEEEKASYMAAATKAAIDTGVVNLNKCINPDPFVVKIKIGSNVVIKNNDNKDHKIRMTSGQILTIPADSEQGVKIDFQKGSGVYTYRCDGVAGVAGFFFAVHE